MRGDGAERSNANNFDDLGVTDTSFAHSQDVGTHDMATN